MSQSRSKFIEWAAFNPIFWEKYENLSKVIENYYFNERTDWNGIFKKCYDVLDCENIYFDYDEVEAYGFLHFLDRYHRFQKIFLKIFMRGFFPTPRYEIDVLDIGTGPAPSLFALNDFINILRKYGSLYNKKLKDISYKVDYLERSGEFVSWISRIQESTYRKFETDFFIPINNQFIRDFEKLNLRKEKLDYRKWLIEKLEDEYFRSGEEIDAQFVVDHIENDWKHAYRYNIIIMSNFLTKIESVDRFRNEILSSVYSLRNNGILIIVTGATDKYEAIISEVNNLLLRRSFDTKRAKGELKFVIKRIKMKHNWNDYFGSKIMINLKKLVSLKDYEKYTDKKFQKVIAKTLSKGHVNKWYLTVFQKKFVLKSEKKEQ